MPKTLVTTSTSDQTMVVSPIVLRENSTTRLVFHPLIIRHNPHNSKANLKGSFVFERKGPNDTWESTTLERLSSFKKGEGYELSLSSEEILKLLSESEQLKAFYAQYGFSYGERSFIVTEENAEGIFVQISNPNNKDLVKDRLKRLEENNFDNLQSLISSTKIDKILEKWEKNKTNSDESFWQDLFESNVWVLQQLFSYPIIILQGETYVGGKNTQGRNGHGGVATDFLGQDLSTNSFAVIEIKTPMTKTVGGRYRGEIGGVNETYSMDSELSGGVVQLQNQVHTAIQKFKDNLGEDFSKEKINHLCPHGVLIIGKSTDLNESEKKSFFLFRKSFKDITIMMYDELFKKIEFLRRIFDE